MSLPPPPLDPRPHDAPTLAYANPLELPRKPAILDVLGIMSIVVASISILASVAFMFGAVRLRPVVRTWQVQSPPTAAQMAAAQAQAARSLAEARDAVAASREETIRALKATTQSEAAGNLSAETRAQLEKNVAEALKRFDELQSSSELSPTTATTSATSPASRPAQARRPLPPHLLNPSSPPALSRPRTVVSAPLIDWPSTMISVVIELSSVAIAGYLLFCGVIVIQNSPRGYWHHINYARLKIVLVLSSLLAVIAANIIGKESGPVGMLSGILVMTGWIYPIAVLIVMRRPGVIRYYRSLMGNRTAT